MAEFRLRAGANDQSRDPCDVFRQALPDEIMISRLSTNAKLLAGYLWARARWREGTLVSIKNSQIMDVIERSEKAARQCLQQLVDADFMSRVSSKAGRQGGQEFRVFGPGKLNDKFKLVNRPDGEQLSLWPFDGLESPSDSPVEDDGESAAETRRKRGVFDGEIAGFPGARAQLNTNSNPSVAQATEGQTSTSTTTSMSKSLSMFKTENASAHGALQPGENDGKNAGFARVNGAAVASRFAAISRTLSQRFGSPHRLQRKFLALAALLAEGGAVHVGVPHGGDLLVSVSAESIDDALAAAVRGSRQDVSKLFYWLLRDRLRKAARCEAARMPHSEAIRQAFGTAGLNCPDDFDKSPADLSIERRDVGGGS